MEEGFIDLHQHVLWGMDDGPQTADEMHALLHADVKDGIRVVAATPHAHPGIRPFDLAMYRSRLAEAQAYCDANGLPLQLISGAEIRYTPSMLPMLQDGRLPTIGDSEYVLVEFWHSVSRDEFEQAISALFRHGYIPIVAHVERYALFHGSLGFVLAMKKDYEVYYQSNCGFLLSRRLSDAILRRRLLKRNVIDLIASDAHNTGSRAPHMSQAFLAFGKQRTLSKMIPTEKQ